MVGLAFTLGPLTVREVISWYTGARAPLYTTKALQFGVWTSYQYICKRRKIILPTLFNSLACRRVGYEIVGSLVP